MSRQCLLLLAAIHVFAPPSFAPPSFAAAQVAEIQRAPEDAQRLREAAQRAEFNRRGRVELLDFGPARIAPVIAAPRPVLIDRQNFRLSVSLSGGKVQMQLSGSRKLENDNEEYLQTAIDELRQCVEALARIRIKELDAFFPLTQAQQAKLRLATRLDAHRASRLIREWYGESAANLGAAKNGVVDIALLAVQIAEINAALNKHVHGADSLFYKVAQTLLSDEQRRAITNRHLTWFMEKAGLAIRDDQQRQQFFELLVRNADRGAITFGVEAYCCQVVRSLSEAELAAFLDEKQLRGLFEIVNYYEQKARK